MHTRRPRWCPPSPFWVFLPLLFPTYPHARTVRRHPSTEHIPDSNTTPIHLRNHSEPIPNQLSTDLRDAERASVIGTADEGRLVVQNAEARILGTCHCAPHPMECGWAAGSHLGCDNHVQLLYNSYTIPVHIQYTSHATPKQLLCNSARLLNDPCTAHVELPHNTLELLHDTSTTLMQLLHSVDTTPEQPQHNL